MTFCIFKNYYFRIIIKNLTKCNTLKTFALKNNEKFADHNLENLCPRSLASTIPVLVLEKVCPRKVGPWPWPRIFFESLALMASKAVSSNPPLLISTSINLHLVLINCIFQFLLGVCRSMTYNFCSSFRKILKWFWFIVAIWGRIMQRFVRVTSFVGFKELATS